MPSEKRKNVGLSSLLEGLINARIEFILVGGLAAWSAVLPRSFKERPSQQ
jgi:hypothetical protein